MHFIVYGYFILMGISFLLSGTETWRTGIHRFWYRKHVFAWPIIKSANVQQRYLIGATKIVAGIICLIASLYMIVMQDDNWFGFAFIVSFTMLFVHAVGGMLSWVNRKLTTDREQQLD